MKIGYDLDDVIIEFAPGVYRWLGEPYRGPMHIWTDPFIVNNFHRVQYDVNFWLQLKLLNGPMNLSVQPDVFVTHRCISNDITKRYLDMVGYAGVPVYTVPRSVSKADKLKELEVTHFVDDKLSTYNELEAAGIVSVLYIPPYHLPKMDERRAERQISNIQNYSKYCNNSYLNEVTLKSYQ